MNQTQARDEIFTMLRTAWNANAQAAVDYAYLPDIIWQGETRLPPDVRKAYARATVLHATGQQANLAGPGLRRWDNRGVVIVQCFGPVPGGKGLVIAEKLATIALDAYRGKSSLSGAWFRRPRVNEVGQSGGWFQINAVVDFQYDEVT